WHVDREDELTAGTQDAVHLAQQELVSFGRPAFIGCVRLGILNGEPRDDAVEMTARPTRKTGAEVAANEPDASLVIRGIGTGPQPFDSTGVDGSTVEGDDLSECAGAFFPKRTRQLATSAAQVEPAVAGAHVRPVHGVNEQLTIRAQLVLSPEGLGAGGLGPIVNRGRMEAWHGFPTLRMKSPSYFHCSSFRNAGEGHFDGRSVVFVFWS